MAKPKTPRKSGRPAPWRRHPAGADARHLNAASAAMAGAFRIPPAVVHTYVDALVRDLDTLTREARNGGTTWRALADAANVSETFSAMGLGRGEQATDKQRAAQQALHDMAARATATDRWSTTAAEEDAIKWLLELLRLQMLACSQREYTQALHTTTERLRQALAGNAPRGAVVVCGAPA